MAKSFFSCHQDDWNTASFFSSTQECNHPVKVDMNGKIPHWLKGCLYRNGPGQFEVNNDPSTSVNHPFDGFAYINKYEVDGENNTIYFQSSFIKSRAYKESMKRGCLVTRQLGTDPCKSLFSRFQLLFSPRDPEQFPDNTLVTIQRVNNELLALTEVVMGYVIDEQTLETIAPLTSLTFAKPMPTEILTMTTSHVMYDSKRKMTVSYATRITKSHGQWLDVIFIFDDETKLNNNGRDLHHDINDDGDDENVDAGRFILISNNMNKRGQKYNQTIRSKTKSFRYNYEDSASYMHSASITEDYLILSEIPFHFSLYNTLRTILTGDLLTNMFKWNAALPTYFRVIRLDNGEEIARIVGPTLFTFHHINAYQIDQTHRNEIVIDICTYDDHRIIDEFYLKKVRQNLFPSGFGYVRRFHLNLTTKECLEPYKNLQKLPTDQSTAHPVSHKNSLIPIQIEFPRINPNYIGHLYRYVYAVRGPQGYLMDALVKIDLEAHHICGLWQEPCTCLCEPIFVPKPGSAQEDEGIVLTILSTLNLLTTDHSNLNSEQWKLLSNLLQCFDKYSGLIIGRNYTYEQNKLPLKLRYKSVSVLHMTQSLMHQGNSLYISNKDFVNLSENDRMISLDYTVLLTVACSSNLIYFELGLTYLSAFFEAVGIISRPCYTEVAQRVRDRIVSDRVSDTVESMTQQIKETLTRNE
ncbi:hypothetical protein I4U23_022557 [Adineta vaga]|nr:hypothetical protein I4U23_022557 [Adineta vaga]